MNFRRWTQSLVAVCFLALTGCFNPSVRGSTGGSLTQNELSGGYDFIVNSYLDTSDAAAGNGTCADSDGVCTLRAAVEETNALSGSQSILVRSGLSITLGSEIAITEDVLIDGESGTTPTVSGANATRLMSVSATSVIRGMNFEAGTSASPGACFYVNDASLTLADVEIDDCETTTAGDDGGAIHVTGGNGALTGTRITVSNSETEQSAGSNGGGIYMGTGTTLVLNYCKFENNQGLDGGALYIAGSGAATIDGCLFKDNDGVGAALGNGGGFYANSETYVSNTTFTGNQGRYGGGVLALNTTVHFYHVTFYENYYNFVSGGAGIAASGSTINFANSILTNNQVDMTGTPTDSNCNILVGTTFNSLGNNLIDTAYAQCDFSAGAGDTELTEADLGSLAIVNNGYAESFKPNSTSPLIDAGKSSNCVSLDQNGIRRPQGSGCDIGAVEAQ